MVDEDHEPTALEHAKATLLAIPGVASVAYGLKEAGGQIIAQRVLRVHVAYKRALADLDPAERIPTQVEGIPTDVIVGAARVHCSSLPVLTPGVKITRDNPGDFSAGGGGTLGLLVDRGAKRMLLTNDHVLWASSDHAENRRIFSPEISGARDCPCNRACATFPDAPPGVRAEVQSGARTFYIDAKLAALSDGVKSGNLIDGIGPVTGGRDLSTAAVASILGVHLHKRGAITNVTDGTIVAASTTHSGQPDLWELTISNPTGGAEYDETYTLEPGQNTTAIINGINTLGLPITAELKSNGEELRVHGKIIGFKGDSGSIWVDDAGKAVALLYGMIGVQAQVKIYGVFRPLVWGRVVACYIKPVFDAMGLTWPTAISAPTLPSHGPIVGVERAPWPDPRIMRDLETQLLRTPRGRTLAALAQQLYQQVATLVHHRRRVTVTWHRNRGPVFVNAFLRTMSTPDRRLPTEIGGVRLVDAIARMRAALEAEGSPVLRDALATHGDWIQALAACATSVPELLSELEGGE